MKLYADTNKKYLYVLLLLSLLSIVYVKDIVTASPATKLYVDPPSIIDTLLVPPKNFTVSVKVADVAGLYGVEFKLKWDTSLLDLARVTLSLPWSPYFLAVNQTNEALGQYWISVTAIPPSPAYTGSRTLLTFVFKVTGLGSTYLDLVETILGDQFANPIPHDAIGGYFANVPVIPAYVHVQPPSIIDPNLTPSKNFTVDIDITKVNNLHGFDFKLSYNTTVLDVAKLEEGSFLESAGTTVIDKMQDDPMTGTVWIAIYLASPASFASGNGTLATITFQVVQKGESALHLYDVVLKDQSDKDIVYVTTDGYFNNVLLARLYVDPPLIIDPTLTPSSTFSIDIKVANITNLFGYEFTLTYDTSFLNGLGIRTYPHPSNETHFTSRVEIDDRNGRIFVNVSYYPPAQPITSVPPLTLTTIVFQVQSYGASVLRLGNSKLVDSHGSPIVHVTSDGFVSVKAPDVAILEVNAIPTLVYPGTHVDITVTAGNLGIFRDETFNVTAYYGATVLGTVTVTDLPPMTNTTLPFSWDTTGMAPGDYVISARASVVSLETNTTNNYLSDGTVHIVSPDVAVVSVGSDVHVVYQGWKVNVTVVVQNQGLLPASFDVTTYYDNNTISAKTVTGLGSGLSTTLVFLWDTATAPYCHNYTISAKASILPGEVDVADNALSDGKVKVRIVGDVNGDGIVNVLDLIAVSNAFDTYPGNPKYNLYADINRDGRINVLDMILVSTHLGLHC